MVEFLATDLSDYVTGAVIPIDGALVSGIVIRNLEITLFRLFRVQKSSRIESKILVEGVTKAAEIQESETRRREGCALPLSYAPAR